jgi:hypothetical protein
VAARAARSSWSRGLAVAEAGIEQAVEGRGALGDRKQVEQVVGRQRQDAALGDVVLDLCLPGRHPAFERERFDLHNLYQINTVIPRVVWCE